MKHHIQHQSLEVQEFEAAHWAGQRQLRNHFELISIRSGSGTTLINQQPRRYQAGSLFLLGPADDYSFDIEQLTGFGLLRFTEDYLNELTAKGIRLGTWQQIGDYTLPASLGIAGSIEMDTADQQQVEALLVMLFTECAHRDQSSNDSLAESLMGAVLSLVSRRLPGLAVGARPALSYARNFVQRLLAYIQRHITQPEFLRVERLATEFAYSPNHLSALFKQETGESLHQYILRYKLKLVETRLLSTLTISQIADELAFTDVSHLNKLFKKHYDSTPTNYRRHLATLSPASAGELN